MYLKKKFFLPLLLLVLILTVTTVSASENSTDNVLSLDENMNMECIDVGENTHSFQDIQNEIDKVEENSTITLNGTYVGLGREILINKSITLKGVGSNTVFDANSSSRILNITSGKVTLKNLNFINGKALSDGGGAIFTAAELIIDNCTFKNNTATVAEYSELSASALYNLQGIGEYNPIAQGGAIYSKNNLTIINSNFIDNTAESTTYKREMDYYWGVSSGEGGTIYSEGIVILKNTRLNGFFGSSDIECMDDLEIYDCEFSYAEIKTEKNLLVNNSKFMDGSSLILPDYFRIYGTSCIIRNSNFKYNHNYHVIKGVSNSFLIENNSFTDNIIDGYSLISISANDVEISGNNFINNSITHVDLIFLGYSSCNANIFNNNFTNNKLFGNHFYDSKNSIISMKNDARIIKCSFINNSAPTAGAIRCYNANLLIENCNFKNNSHVAINVKNANLTINGIDRRYYSQTLLDDSFKVVSNYLKVNLPKTLKFNVAKRITVKIPMRISYNKDMNIGFFIQVSTEAAESYYREHGYYKNLNGLYCNQFRDSKNGIATFYLDNLPVGTYVLKLTQDDYDLEFSSILKITKMTTVKAPKVTAKYKKSKYFKITVKSGKKVVKNLKIKIKVYTGKKYKTYTLKTNKKGIATFNTKKLKRGNHKVIITSGNKNYSVSFKSNIKIK